FAWGRVTNFGRAIIIYGKTFYYGVNLIAIGKGFLNSLQNDHPSPLTGNGPLRLGIKSPAMPVRRNNAALLVKVTSLLREQDRYAPRQRHVTLEIEKILASHAYGHERS